MCTPADLEEIRQLEQRHDARAYKAIVEHAVWLLEHDSQAACIAYLRRFSESEASQ